MRYLFIAVVIVLVSCNNQPKENPLPIEDEKVSTSEREIAKEVATYFLNSNGQKINKISKSDEQWKDQLTKIEYYVIRDKGTERSFTGDLLKNKEKGVYTCAACQLPLFESETKYKSGTGWPSFYIPIDTTHILEDTDYDLGYARTEVMCKRCEGHLGHVFNDGPQPTGLRYCINSVSLDFEAE